MAVLTNEDIPWRLKSSGLTEDLCFPYRQPKNTAGHQPTGSSRLAKWERTEGCIVSLHLGGRTEGEGARSQTPFGVESPSSKGVGGSSGPQSTVSRRVSGLRALNSDSAGGQPGTPASPEPHCGGWSSTRSTGRKPISRYQGTRHSLCKGGMNQISLVLESWAGITSNKGIILTIITKIYLSCTYCFTK